MWLLQVEPKLYNFKNNKDILSFSIIAEDVEKYEPLKGLFASYEKRGKNKKKILENYQTKAIQSEIIRLCQLFNIRIESLEAKKENKNDMIKLTTEIKINKDRVKHLEDVVDNQKIQLEIKNAKIKNLEKAILTLQHQMTTINKVLKSLEIINKY